MFKVRLVRALEHCVAFHLWCIKWFVLCSVGMSAFDEGIENIFLCRMRRVRSVAYKLILSEQTRIGSICGLKMSSFCAG